VVLLQLVVEVLPVLVLVLVVVVVLVLACKTVAQHEGNCCRPG